MSDETEFLRVLQQLGVRSLGSQWPPFGFAYITEVTPARGYRIQRIGAAAPDNRYYKRLEGRPIAAGDLVLFARVSGSLVLLGRLTLSDVIDDCLFQNVCDAVQVLEAVEVA
jgi:hypothetical protein